MDVIIIPKEFIKNDDLVVMPRKQYEKLLDIFKRQKRELRKKNNK